ncbi:MAG: filamentous hemagglutinin N-terminal domain-containing protein, partial [Pseudomonadota bacterium]|nr:filamentous hemagglutinin N-terminal domain-containing protein [Pseudomonadota bacterium]
MKWIPIIIMLSLPTTLGAEIITDGHLGQAVALQGPHYRIEAQLGQQYGNNLFHSFQEFNINSGEQATFLGPKTINTLIARVTGGHPSHLNGLLRSSIPEIYFINPYGLTFDAKAQLDIQGSFHASTADTIYFQDGGEFNARQPTQSLLTTAPISAFGFLTATPAALTVAHAELKVPTTATLSLTGGELNIHHATLSAEAGHLALASFAKANSVTLNPFATTTADGPLTVEQTEIRAVSGGHIYIHAGQFKFRQSHITNDNVAFPQPKAIEIRAQDIYLEGSTISSTSWGSGAAGPIRLQATDSIQLSGFVPPEGQGSFIAANARHRGNGGDIDIHTTRLQLLDGAKISSFTLNEGQGGHLQITADYILLAGADRHPFPSMITTATNSQGNGGNIDLTAGELHLSEGALIFADSIGRGRSGNINLTVKGLARLTGESQNGFVSAITASSHGVAAQAGAGGHIYLHAGQLQLRQGAQIRTATFGSAPGGHITIEVDNNASFFAKSRQGYPSGIFASSEAQGDAGLIVLAVGQYLRMQDSAIQTSAQQADGGDIHLKALNYIYLTQSEISTSVSQAFGNGGNIVLTPEFIILDDSQIIAQAKKGRGGNIDITTTGIYTFSQEPLKKRINAASELGVDGVVAISTPETHVEESLVILSSQFMENEQIHALCEHLSELPAYSFI